MSNINELPQLATELFDLSKQYLRQETLEPAKRLGKVAGLGLAAALLLAIGAMLLATAGMRFLVDVLPEGELWRALALFVSALVLGGTAGVIVWRSTR